MSEKKAYNRAKTVEDILRYNPKCLEFEGKWMESFGKPERSGCWIIWGNSGNGKTAFTLMLCRYLAEFGRVAYNSLEEGLSLSFKKAVQRVGMNDPQVKRNFTLLDKEEVKDLRVRLTARKSPDFIVIDSIQYSGLNKDTAKALVDSFPNKLFIFISHADGKHPAGRTASAIRFHANVKLFVEGYMIKSPISRYKEDEPIPFVIWQEGAERCGYNAV